MNKPLDKKLQMYIAKKSISSLPFGGGQWFSSAKNLSDTLKNRGVNMQKKLYWEYKLPDNMTHQQFMDKIIMVKFYRDFYNYFLGTLLLEKQLSGSEKIQIIKYVLKKRRQIPKDIMKQWANTIKENNPVLQSINQRSDFGLVSGALFGFAPDEIKYFTDKQSVRDMQAEHNVSDILEQHGVRVNYVLAPETAAQLINALKYKGKN